jgi:aldehyde:ferredoxin oxidoreductase
MNKGYMGKVLLVDLDKGSISVEKIPDSVYEHYLAGEGLGAYLLYKWIPAGADPLGPENILGFMPGLLTGTGSLFSGRWMVVCKSPLTGTFGYANCGGNFSPMIKRCGYDGIFFKGISPKPVYLFVDTGKAELRDAAHVWGKDAVESEELLMAEGGLGSRVACIGPAGEKVSLISGICNDGGRLAARSGVGAVMGSKRLKAVVLNGKRRIGVRNPLQMKYLSKKCNRWIKYQPPAEKVADLNYYLGKFMRISPICLALNGIMAMLLLRTWGTTCMNQLSVEQGDAPIKNWKGSNLDFGKERSKFTSAKAIAEREYVKYHCYSCPLGCGGRAHLPGKEGETHKPEYETFIALGGLCMNDDPDSIYQMNDMLNRAGMDTISAGAVVAFAFECYEEGLLTKEDTGGLELVWGDGQVVVSLIERMIAREGIGDILADGVKVASKRFGKGSEHYAMHVGGQEAPMHDGRNDPGCNIHYAVEPTPGRHTIGSQLFYEFYELWKVFPELPKIPLLYFKKTRFLADEEKALSAVGSSKWMNLGNASGFCLFGMQLGVSRIPVFDWLNAATGWDKSPHDYMAIGARIQTLKQSFNIKHGIDPRSMKVNKRMLGLTPVEGANKGHTMDLDKMVRDYWNQFGWDPQTGRPSEAAIADLKLNELQ